MMKKILCGAVLLFLALPSSEAVETSHVTLRLLDKVTARVSQVTLAKEESVAFGNLQISMHYCDRTPPTEVPESTALLEIIQEGESGQKTLFYGWMFASSPAVNPLQHAVYDVWVLECKDS